MSGRTSAASPGVALRRLCLLKTPLVTVLLCLDQCVLGNYLESKQKLPLVSLSRPD